MPHSKPSLVLLLTLLWPAGELARAEGAGPMVAAASSPHDALPALVRAFETVSQNASEGPRLAVRVNSLTQKFLSYSSSRSAAPLRKRRI